MITKTINNSEIGITNGTIQFPNAYCFVFNPNYIFLELGTEMSSVSVEITDGLSTYSVSCILFKGSGRCYISRLLELLFVDEYLEKRSASVTINIKSGNEGVLVSSSTTIAIWGSMKVGDTFGGGIMLGSLYSAEDHARFMREVIWFKNFPFKVSMFSPSASKSLTLKEDRGIEKQSKKRQKQVSSK